MVNAYNLPKAKKPAFPKPHEVLGVAFETTKHVRNSLKKKCASERLLTNTTFHDHVEEQHKSQNIGVYSNSLCRRDLLLMFLIRQQACSRRKSMSDISSVEASCRDVLLGRATMTPHDHARMSIAYQQQKSQQQIAMHVGHQPDMVDEGDDMFSMFDWSSKGTVCGGGIDDNPRKLRQDAIRNLVSVQSQENSSHVSSTRSRLEVTMRDIHEVLESWDSKHHMQTNDEEALNRRGHDSSKVHSNRHHGSYDKHSHSHCHHHISKSVGNVHDCQLMKSRHHHHSDAISDPAALATNRHHHGYDHNEGIKLSEYLGGHRHQHKQYDQKRRHHNHPDADNDGTSHRHRGSVHKDSMTPSENVFDQHRHHKNHERKHSRHSLPANDRVTRHCHQGSECKNSRLQSLPWDDHDLHLGLIDHSYDPTADDTICCHNHGSKRKDGRSLPENADAHRRHHDRMHSYRHHSDATADSSKPTC